MNKKGFTLIELLAVLVILSIIMGIAIPNIVSILDKNKKENYIADAKKFVALAKTELSTRLNKPRDNEVAKVYLACVDNQDLTDDPNGDEYSLTKSFVAVVKKNGEYVYYVNLVSKEGRGIAFVEEKTLDSDKRLQSVSKNIENLNDSEILLKTELSSGVFAGDSVDTLENVKCASIN